jgi:hypothetical protein
MSGIQSGKLLNDVQFELYDINDQGEIVKVQYKGAWVIVDNGYMNSPTCIPPMKAALTTEEERWSQWLESMRKDVECTFGILKKRWRILKSCVRIRGVENTDKIFRTCCALHNFLLKSDGLDTEWENDVQTNPSSSNDILLDNHLFAVNRLHNVVIRNHWNNSSTEIDCLGSCASDTPPDGEGAGLSEVSFVEENVVKDLSQSLFRSKLITHFNICFQQNEIVWPSRT